MTDVGAAHHVFSSSPSDPPLPDGDSTWKVFSEQELNESTHNWENCNVAEEPEDSDIFRGMMRYTSGEEVQVLIKKFSRGNGEADGEEMWQVRKRMFVSLPKRSFLLYIPLIK